MKRHDKVGIVLVIFLSALYILSVIGIAFVGEQEPKSEWPIIELVADGLNYPIGFDIMPDGTIYYGEFVTGNINVIAENGSISLYRTVPVYVESGMTGLLDVEVDPFGRVFVFHTYKNVFGKVYNKVIRSHDYGYGWVVSYSNLPTGKWSSTGGYDHFGGRLAFDSSGNLYVTIGDATQEWEAQNLTSLRGKILRLDEYGWSIWASGVRNPFGIDIADDGTVWFSDNGPVGYDELNSGKLGGNYGWPVYQGDQVRTAILPWMEGLDFIEPEVTWEETVVPTGVAVVGNKVFVGLWASYQIWWLDFVTGQTGFFQVPGTPLDLEAGPDGNLYFSTMDSIYKIVRR